MSRGSQRWPPPVIMDHLSSEMPFRPGLMLNEFGQFASAVPRFRVARYQTPAAGAEGVLSEFVPVGVAQPLLTHQMDGPASEVAEGHDPIELNGVRIVARTRVAGSVSNPPSGWARAGEQVLTRHVLSSWVFRLPGCRLLLAACHLVVVDPQIPVMHRDVLGAQVAHRLKIRFLFSHNAPRLTDSNSSMMLTA
jgi:hypothetical protein